MKKVTELNNDTLLEIADTYDIYLEGPVLKMVDTDSCSDQFKQYISECISRDTETRTKRIKIAKQYQEQLKSLEQAQYEKELLNSKLQDALSKTQTDLKTVEQSREDALYELDLLQKRNQFKLINVIVKIALSIIMGVGILTTILYMYVLSTDADSTIIETTWSNLFGILLTNSFSIIGTIMGVRYATNNKSDELN